MTILGKEVDTVLMMITIRFRYIYLGKNQILGHQRLK